MIVVHLPTARDFWKAVALFAYRRWVRPQDKKPVGIPGSRDPELYDTAICPGRCATFTHDGETGHVFEYERGEQDHVCIHCRIFCSCTDYEYD